MKKLKLGVSQKIWSIGLTVDRWNVEKHQVFLITKG